MTTARYAVDRIEGQGRAAQVVLVADETGAEVPVMASALPAPVREGAVLQVPIRGGRPVWGDAVFDPAAEAVRRKAMEERTSRLRRGDPGGDRSL